MKHNVQSSIILIKMISGKLSSLHGQRFREFSSCVDLPPSRSKYSLLFSVYGLRSRLRRVDSAPLTRINDYSVDYRPPLHSDASPPCLRPSQARRSFANEPQLLS